MFSRQIPACTYVFFQAEAVPTHLFEKLKTSWTFTSLSSSSSPTTKVDLEIEYAFANPIYAAIARQAMEKMSSQMISAFERRAQEMQS